MNGSEVPFDDETVETRVLDDVGYAFESASGSVTVRTEDGDEHDIEFCNVEVDKEPVRGHDGSMYYEAIYALTVPAVLDVEDGDDVIVSGFESSWRFTFVTVDSVTENLTTVFSEYIEPMKVDTDEQ